MHTCKFLTNFARSFTSVTGEHTKITVMIQSMTGYGKAETHIAGRKLSIELRSLNSKQFDLNARISPELKEREQTIRQLLAQKLERGKIDLRIELGDSADTPSSLQINHDAFIRHYRELQSLRDEMGLDHNIDLTSAVLRLKDVVQDAECMPLDEEEWQDVSAALDSCIGQFVSFRKQEGQALQNMFTDKLDAIMELLREVEPYEKGRIDNIRQHLLLNLDKLAEQTKKAVDSNRLEQEMIYYLEKLDITEEKVRLTNHVRYFRETMEQNGEGVGKKLGFIAQEMGREINTLGSKSNQSEMQIIVVKMKDLLEQIKEQVLNVL